MRLFWNQNAAAVPLAGAAGTPRVVAARVERVEAIPRRSVTVPPPRTDGLETPGTGSKDFLAVQTPERLALEANEILYALYNLAQQIESKPGGKGSPSLKELSALAGQLSRERGRVECLISHADPLMRAKAEETSLQLDLAFGDLSYLESLRAGEDPAQLRREHDLTQRRTQLTAQFTQNAKAVRPFDADSLRQVAVRNQALYREFLDVQWALAKNNGGQTMSQITMKHWDLGATRWFSRGVKAARRTFQKVRKILTPSAWKMDRVFLAEKQRRDKRAKNFTLAEQPALAREFFARLPVPHFEQLKPFCNLRQAQANTLDMAGKMFGLTFQRVPQAASFDSTNHVYRVTDGSKLLGEITLDLVDRPGKVKRARTVRISEDPRRVVIQCALPDLGDGITNPIEFRSFLHELGHGLRNLLQQKPDDEQHDFVMAEAPSMFLDLWGSQPEVFRQIFRSKNGTPMPEPLMKAMLADRRVDASRNLYAAASTSLLALNSQDLDPRQVDLDAMVRDLSQPPPGTRPWRQDDADQLFTDEDLVAGPQAYVYTGVRPVVYQLLERFRTDGLLSLKAGRAMRRLLLEPSTVGRAGVEAFCGKRLSTEAMERAAAADGLYV